MALTELELQKVNKHLAGKLRACPMCRNEKWEPLEIVAPPVLRRYVRGSLDEQYAKMYPTTERQKPFEAIPLLLVACTNCFHVVPYAWPLIEAQGV